MNARQRLTVSASTTLPRLRARRGIALPLVLFGLVTISLLSAGIYVVNDAQATSVRNRESATRALLLSEEALAHAFMVVRTTLRKTGETRLLIGSDNAGGTSDDGLLVGYTLTSDQTIPDTGKLVSAGRYTIQIWDDQADANPNPLADANFKIRIRCTAVTADGATATIEAIVASVALPAVATEGNLTVNGNPQILGACGGAHANGTAFVSGNPDVVIGISASGPVNLSGTITDTLGNPIPPMPNQPPLEIPDYDPLEFCGPAAYVLNANGWITVTATGQQFDARSNPKFGWKLASSSPIVWDHDQGTAVPGTVCAHGNVKVSGNVGSDVNPLPMSIIATGSVEISGNPYLISSHPDEIAVLAGGDLKVSGNPGSGFQNYEGLMYSRSQCMTNGNPAIFGQLLCKNSSDPAGSIQLVDFNQVPGNPTITSDCNGLAGRVRRIASWYQPLN
jgi:hypothetical protein